MQLLAPANSATCEGSEFVPQATCASRQISLGTCDVFAFFALDSVAVVAAACIVLIQWSYNGSVFQEIA